MRQLGALAAVLVLAGCTPGTIMNSETTCNLALFAGALSFVLPEEEASALTAAPSNVQPCMDTTCWGDALDDTGKGRITNFDAQSRQLTIAELRVVDGGTFFNPIATQAKADVSLTIIRDGGTVLTHAWSGVDFEKTEPNGKGCGDLFVRKTPLTF